MGVEAGDYVYDDEPDEAPGVTGQELMELDGMSFHDATRWPLMLTL